MIGPRVDHPPGMRGIGISGVAVAGSPFRHGSFAYVVHEPFLGIGNILYHEFFTDAGLHLLNDQLGVSLILFGKCSGDLNRHSRSP